MGDLCLSAAGVPAEEIKTAIELGVCKINIATDMRLIWTRVHREFFKAHPEKFDMVIPGADYTPSGQEVTNSQERRSEDQKVRR